MKTSTKSGRALQIVDGEYHILSRDIDPGDVLAVHPFPHATALQREAEVEHIERTAQGLLRLTISGNDCPDHLLFGSRVLVKLDYHYARSILAA